jgi:hypothetical protein
MPIHGQMATDVERLAARFLEEESESVLADGSGSDWIGHVAVAIGVSVRRDAVENGGRWPRDRAWFDDQFAILELARRPGVDERGLARSLLDAIVLQRAPGRVGPLDPGVGRWVMRWCEDEVLEALAIEGPSPRRARLERLMWSHSSERAIAWMVTMFRESNAHADGLYQQMRQGRMRAPWEADDWSRRVHALCDARLEGLFLLLDEDLPVATCAAQMRLACTYSSQATEFMFRLAARNLRRHRTGVAEDDVPLFWWEIEDDYIEEFRTFLEISGPPAARSELVATARRLGLIDDDRAAFLGVALPRPAWADEDVAWEVDEIDEAGQLDTSDGVLYAGDPYTDLDAGVRIDVRPGCYAVRVIKAIHPIHGRECAAAEVILAPGVVTAQWEPIGRPCSPDPSAVGHRAEVGVGCFASRLAIATASIADILGMDLPGSHARHRIGTAGDDSIVAFSVGPQHQCCRTWLGRGEDGEPTRVLTDLGLLNLDPAANPDLPLRPQRRAADPPTRRPRPQTPNEKAVGIASDELRIRAEDLGRANPRWIRVAEVLESSETWLRQPAVAYYWTDTRAGELLPATAFATRFIRPDG